MMRRSIARRLIVLFAGVTSLGFLGLGLYLSAAIEAHFEALDSDALKSAVGHVRHALQSGPAENRLAELHQRMDNMMIGHGRISVLVTDSSGKPLVSDSAIAFPQTETRKAMDAAAPGRPVLFAWSEGEHTYRGLAARLGEEAGASLPPVQVAVALSTDQHAQFMTLFRRALWIAVSGAIAISVVLGVVIVRRGMKPIGALANHIRDVSSSRLNERVRLDDLPVELRDLGDAFNIMMTRLDESFRRLSEFSADIAHELRTPVSNLLTQTQVILSRNRGEADYRDVLASNAEELERLTRMVSDMLFLARTDNGTLAARDHVDLAAEARELFDFYEALAAEKGVSLSLSGAVSVEGDRLMLRRAINNLLSNAIRYTAPDHAVTVHIEQVGDAGAVQVSNPGRPIPKDVRERLFERFYREDLSRVRDSDGAGLGLAIVKAIVLAHGGGVAVDSDETGNTFSFWIPLRQQQSGEPARAA